MNGLPAEMIDRWEHRAEPAPGDGLIYWHMLLGDNPDATAIATEAQERLVPFSGLHMTPLKWLHMTVMIAASAQEIDGEQVELIAAGAARRLAAMKPASVTLGKVLYHPEAIMLAARPAEALIPVLEAAREATHEVTGSYGQAGNKLPFTPHVTVSYSESRQPARPLIDALGLDLPARQIQVGAISLVNQHGPERRWDWQVLARVPIGPDLP